MDLMDKKVKVIKGYYKDNEGIVSGSTVDGYWLVKPKSNNGFWAKSDELNVVESVDCIQEKDVNVQEYIKAYNDDRLVVDGKVEDFLIYLQDEGYYEKLIKERASDTIILNDTPDGNWRLVLSQMDMNSMNETLQNSSDGVLQVLKYMKDVDTIEDDITDEILRRLEGRISLLRELVDFRMGRTD